MLRWPRLALGSCALAALLVTAPPRPCLARAEAEVGYTREQAFSAALRYLRVDLAYDVTEKDAEAAYLLFSFAAPELDKKTARGSIEVVQRERSVRLLVSLPELPSYHEEVLKRGLLDKLAREYGEPPVGERREKRSPRKPDVEPDEPRQAPESSSAAAEQG